MKRPITFTILLLTLTACATRPAQTPEPTATGIPQANMPNPASVFCVENGNELEIHTADDGSQSGVCVFPDGSACDEWAYFRGECGPGAQASSTHAIPGEATADVGGGRPGENASGGYMPPGASEAVTDWWGTIKSTPPGAQYDDYFERQDMGQSIYFGIDSMDPALRLQIEVLRDSGKVVHVYGTLLSNVPDYNGSQILVDRIEVE